MMSIRRSALPPSERSLDNTRPSLMQDLSREIEKLIPYDEKKHPDGLLDLASSINLLMTKEMSRFVKRKINHVGGKALEYGYTAGSPALVSAVTRFVNRHFNPSSSIITEHVMVTNGATALLDQLSFAICDAGEAVMYTTPAYGMFRADLQYRNGIKIIEVPCTEDFDQFISSNSETLVSMFEKALVQARNGGTKVKAVLLCNPCNPLGRAYSRQTLLDISRFCARNDLHLVSDEIYAMSSFESHNAGLDVFTSVLSLGEEGGVVPENIHVVYGASKDFGLGGLRLGFLITRNSLVKEACRRIALFTWIASYSDIVFSQILSDEKFIDSFFNTYRTKLRESYHYTTRYLSQNGIEFNEANAGIFIWVNLSKWLPMTEILLPSNESQEMRLTRWLISKHIYLEPGEAFYSPYAGRFRLCYSKDLKRLKVGLERLVNAIKELERLYKDDDDSEYARALKRKAPDEQTPSQSSKWRLWCFE